MPDDLFTSAASRDVLTVSQLNRRVRQLLETQFPLLWVEGEISNFAAPGSGHWYFTLKDDAAQVRCAMFRNRNRRLRFRPEPGKQVVLRCRVGLYEGRGEYQLVAEHMEEAGEGALQRAFEQLKAKLQAEGLFDAGQKRPIPPLPRHIAVITSPTGAAIHDVLTVLRRRFPAIPVTVLPVAVQGHEAAGQIEHALNLANRAGHFDVVLLTRGGGSLEDMWPFNEERVARAVRASGLPVVCAVGHEVDFSIADFAADARAPTPSAAAEMLSPDGEQWCRRFAELSRTLQGQLLRKMEQCGDRLAVLRGRLRHPGERLQQRAQQLDHLELRLHRAMEQRLVAAQQRYSTTIDRHRRCHPGDKLSQWVERVEALQQQLQNGMARQLENRRQRLTHYAGLLDSVSPLNTLARGYSLTRDESGQVLRGVTSLREGNRLLTRLGAGEVVSRVEERREPGEETILPGGKTDRG